jgi:hypothetical protein
MALLDRPGSARRAYGDGQPVRGEITVAGSLRRAERAQLGWALGARRGSACIPTERDDYGGRP